MQNPTAKKPTFGPENHNSLSWKLFLIYDVIMMVLIVINLITLALQAVILSGFGAWIAQIVHLSSLRQFYIEELSPLVSTIDFYFICYLIAELLIRWAIAIIGKHHQRWWFFPFVHWYEVLAIIPILRFLRLLRAVVIGYRLHELGYQVVPPNILARAKFYYDVVMEELTDRIVLTVIAQVEKELDTSDTHHQLVHRIIDHHRAMFVPVLAETLQRSLAQSLTAHKMVISQNIGEIVQQAVHNTPELTQLLRLMPIVGSRIEQQIQAIGQRLGENITQGIIQPLAQVQNPHQSANPLLTEIATEVSQVPLDSESIDKLVESVVRESLEGIKQQVRVKQWALRLDEMKEL